jgi:exonuclease III
LHLTDLDSLIKAHTQNKIRFLTNKLAGSKKNFTTYHKYDDGERKSFIDHIVVTQNLVDYYVPETCSVYYHNQYKTFSDHNPVYAIFNFNKSE